jgi:preprotein translocase subunit SecD
MLEFPRWKYVLIALVLILSTYYSLPNIYAKDPAVQIAASHGAKIDDALTTRVRGLLDTAKVPYTSLAIEDGKLLVRLASTDLQVKAADVIRPNLGDGYTAALNLAPTTPKWFVAGAKPMKLGLDLQGGVHFLMEVDQVAAREKREAAYLEEIQAQLRDAKVHYTSVVRDAQGYVVKAATPEDADKALTLLGTSLPRFGFAKQPDGSLRGTLSPEVLKTILDDAIDQNIETLRNRVASLAEPVIQRQGANRIIVELPGIQDTAEAKETMGGTDTLEWRAVVEADALVAQQTGHIPPGARLYFQRERMADGTRIPVLLSNRVIVSGDQLVDASPGIDTESGTPMVRVKLDSAGGKRMFKHTLDNVGKYMAIVYIQRTSGTRMQDGKEVPYVRETQEVISKATIREPFGPEFQTSGLSPDEAQNLSKQLKAGALAAPMSFVEERVVGPSLGAENVRSGVNAVVFSFGFVLVFFLVYYKMFGVVTNIALLLQLLMVVAVMSAFGATMSLPGFAGLALTVGMSVDANVLINERIREELRLGLSPLASIAAGYDKASGTIADANVTALLGGLAMAAFGTGPIQSFGITLIIGILTSMYTAVEVSRGIATLIYGRRRKLAALSI